MIITLSGNNDFEVKTRLMKLVDDFLHENDEFALEKLDAVGLEYENIHDAVASMPFLTTKKMVVIRGIAQNKEVVEKIEQIIDAVSDSTDLVFVEPHADKRTVFYKSLKKLTTFEEYAELDASGLAKWVVAESQARGGKLSPSEAAYLVERVGANQLALSNELDKLLAYQPSINRQSIDLLTEQIPQSKIFDLLDATFAGNKRKALELYDDQRAQKVEPQAIMALLAWQLNIIALAKLGVGKTSAQIASDTKLSTYPISKAQTLASKISSEKLKQMIDDAVEIDYKSKNVSIDLDEALKAYILSL